MKTAIITFTVGPKRNLYERIFVPSIKAYSHKWNHAFHQVTDFIGDPPQEHCSRMMKNHIFCMQKLLLTSLPWVQEYDKVLVIDADILINPNTPNIFDECPPGKICAVNERSQYGSTQNVINAWKRIGDGTLPGTAEDYYKRLGFPESFPKQFNGGFVVFEPKIHKEFFESVYKTYMPRILMGEDLDGDQGPLNYEGNRQGLIHYLDERWNRVWLFTHSILYPFLQDKVSLRKAVTIAFNMNYCLHFAGGHGWDILIN